MRLDPSTIEKVSRMAVGGLSPKKAKANGKRLAQQLKAAIESSRPLAEMLDLVDESRVVPALERAAAQLAVPRLSRPNERKMPGGDAPELTESFIQALQPHLLGNTLTLFGRVPLADLPPGDLFVTSSGYGHSIDELEHSCRADPHQVLLAWSFVPFTTQDLHAIACRSPVVAQSLRDFVRVNTPFFALLPPKFLLRCRDLHSDLVDLRMGLMRPQAATVLWNFRQEYDALAPEQVAALNDCPAFQSFYVVERHKSAAIFYLAGDNCAAGARMYKNIHDTVQYAGAVRAALAALDR